MTLGEKRRILPVRVNNPCKGKEEQREAVQDAREACVQEGARKMLVAVLQVDSPERSRNHSHASIMLKQGTHPKVVAERLRHASVQVTIDIYSHVAPEIQKAAAKNFDKLVFQEYTYTCEDESHERPLLTEFGYVKQRHLS